MEYSKLVAVTGIPGLFELINTKTDGAIVKSLDDNSVKFVSSRIHQFSHLESIEIFTTGDNVNLVEVFKAMESAKQKLPDDKDPVAVKKYFTEVYPDMDFDRVYGSDMKKMVKWFSILEKNKVELKLTELPEEETEDEEVEIAEEEKKPAKKSAKAKKEDSPEEEAPKTPKKKTAAKKDEGESETPKKKTASKKAK